jgi:anti-sigma regulatory factor (Ser/Thr protein kinase)
VPARAALRVVGVDNPTDAAEARRVADRAAGEAGLPEEDRARVALVVTEAATNVLKHAGGGRLFLRAVRRHGVGGVEMLALDGGPGMANVGASMADGYSTAGSSGTGLGAIRRNATEFDLHSVHGGGTAVLARVWPRRERVAAAALDIGGLSMPKPGEDVSGDDWDAIAGPQGARLMVVDGLGHGPFAREAAEHALSVFRTGPDEAPTAVLVACHAALRSTRGAAVALAEVDLAARQVHFAGVGNVTAVVLGNGTSQHLVSVNGTVGHGTFRVREFAYTWPEQGLLVLATDGIQSRWSLEAHPGLADRDPALVAAVLYREYSRQRDDATVVVAREWP